MTERADTFLAAQFQDEIDARIVEALVRVLDRGDVNANNIVTALMNNARFKDGFQRALGTTTINVNQFTYW